MMPGKITFVTFLLLSVFACWSHIAQVAAEDNGELRDKRQLRPVPVVPGCFPQSYTICTAYSYQSQLYCVKTGWFWNSNKCIQYAYRAVSVCSGYGIAYRQVCI